MCYVLVSIFSWVLTRKFCQVEITVHVLLIQQLLVRIPLYFATEITKYSQTCVVCYSLQLEVSTHARKPFPVENAFTIHVNTGHMNSNI